MENTLRHQQPYTDFSRIIRVKSEYIKEGQKIMDDKKVARINELYHKSKAEGLTPEELKEQQILRKEYIDSFLCSINVSVHQSWMFLLSVEDVQ